MAIDRCCFLTGHKPKDFFTISVKYDAPMESTKSAVDVDSEVNAGALGSNTSTVIVFCADANCRPHACVGKLTAACR